MTTRNFGNFIIAVAAGMTLSASALAADSASGTGMRADREAKQQQQSSAPAQQAPKMEQSAAAGGAVTGADFDRETQSVARSLQRGEISVAADGTTPNQGTGVAGSPGQLMGRGGQLTDTGSAGFDGYVDQANRQLKLSEPSAQ